MKRNAKTIEETSKYKIVVENRFDNIPLTFKIWKKYESERIENRRRICEGCRV